MLAMPGEGSKEDEGQRDGAWQGDAMHTKEAGDMRVMQMNYDAFGKGMDSRKQQTDMWQTVNELGVDVMGGQDHRYGELASTIIGSRARVWEGPHTWAAVQGMKRPGGNWLGGVALGTSLSGTTLSGHAGQASDSRGWGTWIRVRYDVHGGKLAVYSAYIPSKSTSNEEGLWGMMEDKLKDGRTREERDPKLAAMNDMMKDVDAQPRGTRVVIMMDANTVWSRQGKQTGLSADDRKYMDALRRKCAERGLKNAWEERHGGEKEGWTFEGGSGQRTHIDMVLVSEDMVESGAVRRVGILNRQLNRSMHRAVVVDINMQAVGIRVGEKVKEPVTEQHAQLQLDNKQEVRRFQDGVMAQISKSEAEQAMSHAEELFEGTEGDQWEQSSITLEQREAAERVNEVIAQVVRAAEKMKRPTGNRRTKNCWSGEFKRKRKRMKMLRAAVVASAAAKLGRARRLNAKAEKEAGPIWTRKGERRRACPEGARNRDWQEWRKWANGEIRTSLGEMHGCERARARRAMSSWCKQRLEAYRRGKCKRQLDVDLKRGGKSVRLTRITLRNGEVKSDKEGMHTGIEEDVKTWFGGGRKKWYMGTRIHANTKEGRILRKRIASGELEALGREASVEEMRAAVPQTDMQEALMEVPRRCWKVLQAARVKCAGDGTRMDEKYEGIVDWSEPITAGRWSQMWGRHKAGVSPGKSKLSINMMKAIYRPRSRELMNVGTK